MKKKKFSLKKYKDAHEEKEITGADGTVITVRNHIPFEEKEKMAVFSTTIFTVFKVWGER